MASYEPIIRMDENSYRIPEKMQSNMSRKPLTDMTNSRKPLAKGKSSVKNTNGFKIPEKVVKPKVARKPLGDVTNSNKPCEQNKSSKKNCFENLSAVNKEQTHSSLVLGEGFLHDHNKCIKAHRQSLNMSMDYFLETVALKKDSAPVITPRPPLLEIDTPMEIDEMEIESFEICAPRSPPQVPSSPGSPCWSTDFNNLEFSPVKLKESPVKLKGLIS